MIQRANVRNDIPQEVAKRIAQALRPWRIVLFGSRARGNPKSHSDYDFFVEVDEGNTPLRAIGEQIRALFTDSGWALDFKVHWRGQLERRRDDPGTVEWDVAREGKVLYADTEAPTVLMPPGRIREPAPAPSEPPESLHELVEAAERDLRHCQHLQSPRDSVMDFSPEICWLSHQTAEKHMKALLVARRVRPERTHDLSVLLRALRGAGVELAEGDIEADCKLLTTHAIEPRYPAGLDLGEDDARLAFAAAERVIAAVRVQLPPRLH